MEMKFPVIELPIIISTRKARGLLLLYNLGGFARLNTTTPWQVQNEGTVYLHRNQTKEKKA